MRFLTQSAAANVMVLMVDSTDHVTGKTGLTLTITASKDGAAFASISPTVTERGNGWYNVALTASHTDTLGDLAIRITGTAADPSDLVCRVVAVNLADSVRAGLTALPNAAANANGGLPILSASGTTLNYILATLTTYTGNTPQTGDSYARLGAPANGSVSADLAAIYAAVDTEVGAIYTRIGAPAGASLAADVAAAKADTAAIKLKTDNLPGDPADASDIATAFSTVNTTLGTIAGYIDTEVAAIFNRIGAPVGASISADIAAIKTETAAILDDTGTAGVALTAAAVDAVHDEAVDGAVTLRQAIRLWNSALGGKASGLATTTAVYRDLADTKDRITATVDADGNRTAVTRDLT